MKPISYFIVFFMALATTTASQASRGLGAPDLLKSFQEFKRDSRDQLIELMSAQDLQLIKESTTDVPVSTEIDSVYFTNSAQTQWALFRSVDLGYLKDVEITVAYETDNVSKSMKEIIHLVSKQYPSAEVKKDKATGSYTIEYKATDTWIVDDRWIKKTYNRLKTVFSYRLTDFGGVLIVEMNETMPRKTIKTIEVPAERFSRLAMN